MAIRQEIKAFRNYVGLYQSELAMMVNVCSLTVHRWETGKSEPSRLALSQLNLIGFDEEGRHDFVTFEKAKEEKVT